MDDPFLTYDTLPFLSVAIDRNEILSYGLRAHQRNMACIAEAVC